MHILVVEDDFTCRIILQRLLSEYGEVHIAANGQEAVEAFRYALANETPYALVCLDINLPVMPGNEVLRSMRELETAHGRGEPDRRSRIVMVTSQGDNQSVFGAFREQCDAYILKPIRKKRLIEHLQEFGLIPSV